MGAGFLMPFIYKLYDNVADVIKAAAEQKLRALEAVGIQAEGDVKDEITDVGAVDTGRLRSSIAHQVDGDSVANNRIKKSAYSDVPP